MEFTIIKNMFHLIDELTVMVESSEDKEIQALQEDTVKLYDKIDSLYIRELRRQKS